MKSAYHNPQDNGWKTLESPRLGHRKDYSPDPGGGKSQVNKLVIVAASI